MVNHNNSSVGKKISGFRLAKSRLRFWPYFVAIFAVVVLVLMNVHTDISTDQNGSLTVRSSLGNIASASSTLPSVTADEAQTANVAASVAAGADLSSSDSVANKSTSMNIIVSLAQGSATSANKPQVANANASAKPVTAYVAKDGDTTSTIAAQFGISDQSVQQSNGLSSDAVSPNSTLLIPAVDGVVYTLKPGENLATVAQNYKANLDDVLAFNNIANANSAPAGKPIVLPDGVAPAAPASAPESLPATIVAKSASVPTFSYAGANAAQVGNRYYFGECTYYAYNRRVSLGLPVGSFWGNANTWSARARASGFLVNHSPSAGAIFQTTAGYYGHVGVVESVNPDGTITISEMNYQGWNHVDRRTIANPGAYNYIH